VLGKRTPPVIVVHDVGGSETDVEEFAGYLQRTFGYAVITPDLRGHGGSKKSGGIEIDGERLSAAEFAALTLDIEACKKYLIDRNDAGDLNIDMLSAVAVGKSCIPAVNWALADWNFPVLSGRRQGQDIKAISLVSPVQAFKGSRMTAALKAPLFSGKDFDNFLQVLVAAGSNDGEMLKEAETIIHIVERDRPQGKSADGKDEGPDGVFPITDYRQNGADLLRSDAGDLPLMIGQLIYFEVYSKGDQFPWMERGKK
jgi:pimeloyl-ACP methyl ester carboxylesterase